ncbi:MAG: DMT family transporter [Lachnospiraceae bacterium]|nr:DMT family transporter [Lachnospiraceae bacterium]
MNRNLKGSFMLLITAIIWGFAFVAQSVGIDQVGPFAFNGIRCIIGGLVLIPVILIINRGNIKKVLTKDALMGGFFCGLCLFTASMFQQWGIMESTVGKASFITALYVVIVPVLGVFVGKKVSLKVWIGVAVSLLGLYLLCMTDSFSLSRGDMFLLICAVCFSVHILIIDYYSPKADGVVISCIQFFVTGILSLIVMAFVENPTPEMIYSGRWSILYAGVLSCGVAYTLQVVFQRDVEPTAASLILCLESVFGVIGGWLLLGQTLSMREILGCILMFIAIVLAQL